MSDLSCEVDEPPRQAPEYMTERAGMADATEAVNTTTISEGGMGLTLNGFGMHRIRTGSEVRFLPAPYSHSIQVGGALHVSYIQQTTNNSYQNA